MSTPRHRTATRPRHPHHSALITAIIAGGAAVATAGPAIAAPFEVESDGIVVCSVDDEVRVGPLTAGTTQGDCGLTAGDYVAGYVDDDEVVPGSWFVGGVILPTGEYYTGWVDNVFGAPEVDVPLPAVPHL